MHTYPPRIAGAVALAAAVTLTMLTSPGATGAVVARGLDDPPAPPWLLYQQEGPDRVEVALIRSDGTGLHNPVAAVGGTGDQSNPDWSPDGRRIVFAMSDGRRDDLWVADADGTDATMLLDCRHACRWLDDPDWSPDGRRIVYSRTEEGAGGVGVSTLETVAVDTGRTRVLLGPWRREFTAGARYAPDGSQIVFERVHKVDPAVEADIDGVTLTVLAVRRTQHRLRALTDPRLYAATADWSPDGRRIVYSALARPDSSAPDLFLVAPDGGKPVRVTHVAADGGYANEPTWDLDSQRLLFSGRLDGDAGLPLLLEVEADGSGLGSAFGADLIPGRHPRVRPVA